MTFDLFRQMGSIKSMTDPVLRPDTIESSEMLIALIVQERNRDAYRTLFLRFAPKLKAFVMGQGMTAPEAEDLAQDVLLNVWRKADYFDPAKASASTWIYTIARNLRIDRARKHKRQSDMPDALKEDLQDGDADPAADERLIAHENAVVLNQHILALPVEQKEVLRLSFFEDLSHGDISRTLGLPLGTVKSRLRLAMMRLKTLMQAPSGLTPARASATDGEC